MASAPTARGTARGDSARVPAGVYALPMLQFAGGPDRPGLRLLVLHDDAEREFDYTPGADRWPKIGCLSRVDDTPRTLRLRSIRVAHLTKRTPHTQRDTVGP